MINNAERARIESPPLPSLREKLGSIGAERISETKTVKGYNKVKEKVGSFTEKVKNGVKSVKGAVDLGVGAMSQEGRDTIKKAAQDKVDQMKESFLQKAQDIRENFESKAQQIKESMKSKVQERLRNFISGEESGSPYGERIERALNRENSEDPMESFRVVVERLNTIIAELDERLSGEKSDEKVTEIPIHREGGGESVNIPINSVESSEGPSYSYGDTGTTYEIPVESPLHSEEETNEAPVEHAETDEQDEELELLEKELAYMQRRTLELTKKIAEKKAKSAEADKIEMSKAA